MLDFVKKAFQNFLEVILWINLIVFIICGGSVGSIVGGAYVIIGIIIGLIIGLLINIIGGGFIATIINIYRNLEEQKILLNNIPIPDDWVCSKCGKNNRKNAIFCTGCGEKNKLKFKGEKL